MRFNRCAMILGSAIAGCSSPGPRSPTSQVFAQGHDRPRLTTRVLMAPSAVRQGDRVTIEVAASNLTRREVLVPPALVVDGKLIMDETGLLFVSDLRNLPVVRNSVSYSPPTLDRIAPGETRAYRLTWTPGDSDLGDGYLLVGLPSQFEEVEPIRIEVTE